MYLKLFSVIASLLPHNLALYEDECGAPEGARALLAASEGRITLIGETHGTEQGPEFVKSLVCLLHISDESVILALEMPHTEQQALDIYLDSDGSESAIDELLSPSEFWNGRTRDGRSSQAMFDLIEYVRQARQEGFMISVLAADYHPEADPDLSQDQSVRDRAMARRVGAAADQADRTLLLVGDVHARRQPMEFNGQTIDTVGSYLDDNDIISVLLILGFGESWDCRMGNDRDLVCGVSEGGIDVFQGPARILTDEEFWESPYADFYGNDFDSFVFLGQSTASLPALPIRDQSSP